MSSRGKDSYWTRGEGTRYEYRVRRCHVCGNTTEYAMNQRPGPCPYKQLHRQRGQALVEFAIVIPVFMLILAGVIQGGVLLWADNTLNQAVRDTARFAATLDCSASAASASETAFASKILPAGPWKSSTATVDVSYLTNTMVPTTTCPDDNTSVVWVKVTSSMQAFVFFPVVPGGGMVSSSTTFRVEPTP